MVLLDILRRRGRALLSIRILRRRGTRPLVGAWETILRLVLRVLVGGHVRARLLGGRWREGGVHLRGEQCQRAVRYLKVRATLGQEGGEEQGIRCVAIADRP